MTKPKPSYNSLRESLRCVNEEAKGYLDRLGRLRDVDVQLRKTQAELEYARQVLQVLVVALRDAQAELARLRRKP